jgi:hypothetical protein
MTRVHDPDRGEGDPEAAHDMLRAFRLGEILDLDLTISPDGHALTLGGVTREACLAILRDDLRSYSDSRGAKSISHVVAGCSDIGRYAWDGHQFRRRSARVKDALLAGLARSRRVIEGSMRPRRETQ